MNVYSAHDYTIYGVLSNLRIYPELERMLGFGCTLTIELWQGVPPLHPSGPARIPLKLVSSEQLFSTAEPTAASPTTAAPPTVSPSAIVVADGDAKVIRILLNASPFLDSSSNVSHHVQSSHEIVLADFLEVEVRKLIVSIRTEYDSLAATASSVAPTDGHEDND
jgi:hypothetical protein